MRRREFIAATLAGLTSIPAKARAQAPPSPMIGYLKLGRLQPANDFAAFRKGLEEMGFVEGRNIVTEYSLAEGKPERLPVLARQLAQRGVSVIVAVSDVGAALAAKAATATIPIVFRLGNNPVAEGLVTSLGRPGGNVTGVTSLSGELTARRFELIHQIAPDATSIAFLINPTSPPSEALIKEADGAATTLGHRLILLRASNALAIEAAFANFEQPRTASLVIQNDTLFYAQAEQLIALAAHRSIPTICYARDFIEPGGLMSYGASLSEEFRLTGIYVGRILKGEKLADLPVQQSSRFELVINMKTAKALGLTIPETLLAIADEVIQ
jgi:putative ABC transport system substrate-binding protein